MPYKVTLLALNQSALKNYITEELRHYLGAQGLIKQEGNEEQSVGYFVEVSEGKKESAFILGMGLHLISSAVQSEEIRRHLIYK